MFVQLCVPVPLLPVTCSTKSMPRLDPYRLLDRQHGSTRSADVKIEAAEHARARTTANQNDEAHEGAGMSDPQENDSRTRGRAPGAGSPR